VLINPDKVKALRFFIFLVEGNVTNLEDKELFQMFTTSCMRS